MDDIGVLIPPWLADLECELVQVGREWSPTLLAEDIAATVRHAVRRQGSAVSELPSDGLWKAELPNATVVGYPESLPVYVWAGTRRATFSSAGMALFDAGGILLLADDVNGARGFSCGSVLLYAPHLVAEAGKESRSMASGDVIEIRLIRGKAVASELEKRIEWDKHSVSVPDTAVRWDPTRRETATFIVWLRYRRV